jgi:hypothetical protein
LNDAPLAGSNAGLVPLNHRRAIHKRANPAIFDWICFSGADPNRPPEICRLQRVGRTDRSVRQFCAFPPSLNHLHLNPENIRRSQGVTMTVKTFDFKRFGTFNFTLADRAALNVKAIICKFQGAMKLDYGTLNDHRGN